VGVDLVAEICRDFDISGPAGPAAKVLPGTRVQTPVKAAPASAPAPAPAAAPGATKEAGGAGFADRGLFSAFSNRRKLFSLFRS